MNTPKGFMGGSMRFGVGDDEVPPEATSPLLPLRLLVVADATPRDPYNAGASGPTEPLKLTLDRFDELFTRLRPRISIEVPSVLAAGREARVELAPTSLRSFRPDGLCAEIPLLRSLLDGRIVLERMQGDSIDQARRELERLWGGSPFAAEVLGLVPAKASPSRADEPVLKAPTANELRVDSILDMVDVGGSSNGESSLRAASSPPPAHAAKATAPSRFGDLIGAIVRSGKSGPVAPAQAIARVDRALSAQIGAILQHPEVRRLEQVYRGLRLLVERAASHTGIRVELLCARPDDAVETLTRVVAHTNDEPPFSCAVVDVEVDGTAAAFHRLEDLACAAEAHNLPLIVNGTATLLGVGKLAEVDKLDHRMGLFLAPERAPWRSAAQKPALRWVTIAANPVLARAPWDKASSRLREAAVQELPNDAGGFVFISPAYAVAALVVASFRDTSWPCRIVGPRSGGVLENLPVHELRGEYEGDEQIAIPTEAFVSTEAQRELAKAGVLLLAAQPNSDSAYVMVAPTAYVPPDKKTYDSATTEPEARLPRVSLPDQLFAARVAQFAQALASRFPAHSPPDDAQTLFEAALAELFGRAKSGGPEVNVSARKTDAGTRISVSIKPERFLGVSVDELSFELPLG